jgi:conjugative transfer relaxase protein TraI
MLSSPSVIQGSASEAASYYLNEEAHLNIQEREFTQDEGVPEGKKEGAKPDYYVRDVDSKQNTEWYGKISERLNMKGQALNPANLEAILNGHIGDQVIQSNKEHRLGYDLTFNAPKSVSILGLGYGDTRLLLAHNNAVKVALDALEKDTAQVRIRDSDSKEMMFENTNNLLIGMVTHKTSRKDDPQLHTHCLVANGSFDQEGKLRALASLANQKEGVINGFSERIYNNRIYYGMVYQSELAKAAVKMGYKTTAVGNGQFEIVGMPDDLKEGFSKRRAQILGMIKDMGLKSYKGSDIATLASRPDKSNKDSYSLSQEWDQSLVKFDGAKFIADSYEKAEKQATMDPRDTQKSSLDKVTFQANKAVEKSIDHLSTFQVNLSHQKVIETALKDFVGDQTTYAELKHALEGKLKAGEVISVGQQASQISTQKLIDKEQTILASTKTGFRNMKSFASSEVLSQLGLVKDNQSTLKHVIQSGRQLNIVEVNHTGLQAIESLTHGFEHSGKMVTVLGQSQLQTQELTQYLSRSSSPLTHQSNKGQYAQTLHQFMAQKNQENTLSSDHVIVVNAAQKLNLNDTQKLIDLTQAGRSKLVFVNEKDAKKGVFSSDAMSILKRGEVGQFQWRNRSISDTRLQLAEVKDDQQRLQKTAQHYANLPEDKRLQTQVFASSKTDAEKMNVMIRSALQNKGILSRVGEYVPTLNRVNMTEAKQQTANSYQSGMVVRFTQRGKNYDYQVDKVLRKQNALVLSNTDQKQSVLELDTVKDSFQVLTKGHINLSPGDQIFSGSKVGELSSGLPYTVKQSNQHSTEFISTDNQVIQVPTAALKGADLRYDYARSVNQQSYRQQQYTLASMKQYAINKNVATDLLKNTAQSVILFTDNQEKASQRLSQAAIKPSGIETVETSGYASIEKYLDQETKESIHQDVSAILSELKTQVNKDVLSKAVDYAIGHITERQAGFKHEKLVKTAINYSMDEHDIPITPKEINDKLEQLQDKGLILSAQYEDGVRWTTQEAIKMETDIMAAVQKGKGQVNSLASTEQIQNHFKAMDSKQDGMKLSQGQKEGVALTVNTTDRFVAIQGYAGTGKSTMLETGVDIVHAAEAVKTNQATRFVGIAGTHEAVKQLQMKNINAQTTKSLLQDTLKEMKQSGLDLSNTVFLLDEHSMVSNKDMLEFVKLVEQTNSRAVLLGDIGQLQSLEAGSPTDLLIRSGTIETAYMTEINRQKDGSLLKAVQSHVNQDIRGVGQYLRGQQGGEAVNYIDPAQKAINVQEVDYKAIRSKIIQQYRENNQDIPDEKVLKHEVNEQAKIDLLNMAAKEYLSRTPESRAQTIIVANSHRERDGITYGIRAGLKEEGSLDANQEITTDRLINLNYTKDQLRVTHNYAPGMVFSSGTDNKSFYNVEKVDGENKVIALREQGTGKVKHITPERMQHTYNTLFQPERSEIAVNEKIVTKFTDKERGILANQSFTVTGIKDNELKLTNKKAQTVSLNTNDIKDKQWDYAWTKTTYGSQGASELTPIIVKNKNSPLNNLLSAYVQDSRAVMHATIISDGLDRYLSKSAQDSGRNIMALDLIKQVNLNKQMPKIPISEEKKQDVYAEYTQTRELQPTKESSKPIQVKASNAEDVLDSKQKNNRDQTEINSKSNRVQSEDKPSTIGGHLEDKGLDNGKQTVSKGSTNGLQKKETKIKSHNTYHKNSQFSTKVYDQRFVDNQGKFDIRRYGDEVAKQLIPYTEDVAKHYLGEPNARLSNNRALKYGAKGSLTLSVQGPKAGNFYNFETKESGNLITLIMNESGKSYADSVKEAARMVNMPEAFEIRKREVDLTPSATDNKISEYGQKIWDNSKPIRKNSLADRHIREHRGITHNQPGDIRFNSGVYTKESPNKYEPAILAAFRNAKGDIQAIEAQYLDRETADKANLNTQKRAYGSKKGAAIIVNSMGEHNKTNMSFVVEGVMTGLSVSEAYKNEHVLVAGGQTNIANLAPEMLKETVVICKDNDNIPLSEDKALQSAIDYLKENDKNVIVSVPKQLDQNQGDNKLDYNDLHRSQGIDAVKNDIAGNITQHQKLDKLIDHAIKQENIQVTLTNELRHELREQYQLNGGLSKDLISDAIKSYQIDQVDKHINTQDMSKSIEFANDQKQPEKQNIRSVADVKQMQSWSDFDMTKEK